MAWFDEGGRFVFEAGVRGLGAFDPAEGGYVRERYHELIAVMETVRLDSVSWYAEMVGGCYIDVFELGAVDENGCLMWGT